MQKKIIQGLRHESISRNEMTEIQFLINKSFPFVEDLLKKYGEYYPFAYALKQDNTISAVGTYNGNDHPESQRLIANLKSALKEGIKRDNYKAVALFCDVRITDPNTNKKTDAVAILTEHRNAKSGYTFYYPYIISDEPTLKFSKSFSNETSKEIFDTN